MTVAGSGGPGAAPEKKIPPPKKTGRGKIKKSPKTRRGNSRENAAPPSFAPPRKKAGRWIEFKPGTKRKDGSRMYYPKWRAWKPGNEKKKWLGPVADLEPMTEKDKNNYVKRSRAAKKRNKQRKQRRAGG